MKEAVGTAPEPDAVQSMLAEHQRTGRTLYGEPGAFYHCSKCGTSWPCDVVKIVALVGAES